MLGDEWQIAKEKPIREKAERLEESFGRFFDELFDRHYWGNPIIADRCLRCLYSPDPTIEEYFGACHLYELR